MPGQTWGASGDDVLGVDAPSMEGRAIARPNRRERTLHPGRHPPSMEGRAIARPNLPVAGGCVVAGGVPSMEGRAIARPNPVTKPQLAARSPPSMEGRAIARPNRRPPRGPPRRTRPSMEGRAIARPNCSTGSRTAHKPNSLQWRAGQLPGQTSLSHPELNAQAVTFNGGPGNCPAKRGLETGGRDRRVAFNGGPGNCPAKPSSNNSSLTESTILQWRAGQLPGQTCHRDAAALRDFLAPSMEGRAIARPNRV